MKLFRAIVLMLLGSLTSIRAEIYDESEDLTKKSLCSEAWFQKIHSDELQELLVEYCEYFIQEYGQELFEVGHKLNLKKCDSIQETFLKMKRISLSSPKRCLVLPILTINSALPTDSCEYHRLICHRSCQGGDPFGAGCCLLGCELAYFCCIWTK